MNRKNNIKVGKNTKMEKWVEISKNKMREKIPSVKISLIA
jgi:hypothetical protein